MYFFTILLILCSLFHFCVLKNTTNLGEPLILTPLLKSGNITEAREQSYVRPFFPDVTSNSGYFTVNEETNSNLFFWFFQKSSEDWRDAPVLLWLQGGPGCSSMFALFTENGPFMVTKGELKRRAHTWTNEYNVLFIDNPVGSGFSFSNDYFVTTQEEIGEHLYEAVIQFFQLYPELGENKFFITGESYAGKYIPALAHTIDKYKRKAKFRVNLKGLLIGNGWSDPENMFNSAQHLHRIGIIDYKTKLKLQTIEGKIRILIRNGLWMDAFLTRRKLYISLQNVTEFKHFYDYLYEKDDDETYIDFLQTDEVRKAIHVGNKTYDDCSNSVWNYLKEDIPKSIKPWIEELLEKYPTMFYSGQVDIVVAHYLTTDFLEELHWSGADIFNAIPLKKWYVDDHLAGYYKEADNLKFALIRDAGHMVPTSKPKVMLDLLNKFINDDL